MHNRRTSEEVKLSAAQCLDEMDVEIEQRASAHKAGTDAPTTGEFQRGGYTTKDYINDPREADVSTFVSNSFGLAVIDPLRYLGISRRQIGTSLETRRLKVDGTLDVGRKFLEDEVPETVGNVCHSTGAGSGQLGEPSVVGSYREILNIYVHNCRNCIPYNVPFRCTCFLGS